MEGCSVHYVIQIDNNQHSIKSVELVTLHYVSTRCLIAIVIITLDVSIITSSSTSRHWQSRVPISTRLGAAGGFKWAECHEQTNDGLGALTKRVRNRRSNKQRS